MTADTIDPGFEANFIKERLADMQRSNPAEAAIVKGIMDTLDYQKAVIRNELQLRNMLLALGGQLVRRSEDSLPRLQGWLAQFVKDGALTSDQAMSFVHQAEAIQS